MSEPDGFGRLRHVMTIVAPGARDALLLVNFGGGALVGTAVGPAGCGWACAPAPPGKAMTAAITAARPMPTMAWRAARHWRRGRLRVTLASVPVAS